jgi:hypothetical protein
MLRSHFNVAISAASTTSPGSPILGNLSLFTTFEIARLRNPQHREVYPAIDIWKPLWRLGNHHTKLDWLIVELFHVRIPQHVSGEVH